LSGYFEYPIGDARRRPRWGVPVRFDIRRLILVDVELWVLDLLKREPTTKEERYLNKIELEKLLLTREQLEAGDRRKSGGGDEWHVGDGVHGVYLGELVWALVARVVPKIAMKTPSRLVKDALSACGFCVAELVKKAEAKSVQSVLAIVGRSLGTGEALAGLAKRGPGARLKVHLQCGREVTVDNYKPVNAFVVLRLWSSAAAAKEAIEAKPDAEAHSQLRVWSKAPNWDETFVLAPVASVECVLQIDVFHCKTSDVVKHPVHMAPTTRVLLGRITIPVAQLLLEDASIGADRRIVGWFPMENMADKSSSGELKLGFQVLRPELLEGLEGMYTPGTSQKLPLGDGDAGLPELEDSPRHTTCGFAFCAPSLAGDEQV